MARSKCWIVKSSFDDDCFYGSVQLDDTTYEFSFYREDDPGESAVELKLYTNTNVYNQESKRFGSKASVEIIDGKIVVSKETVKGDKECAVVALEPAK